MGEVRALAIPLPAVRTDKPEPYVQLLQARGDVWQVQHQPVSLGERATEDATTWVAITQGLANGQRILNGQVGQLREGTVVRLAPAATPATAGAH